MRDANSLALRFGSWLLARCVLVPTLAYIHLLISCDMPRRTSAVYQNSSKMVRTRPKMRGSVAVRISNTCQRKHICIRVIALVGDDQEADRYGRKRHRIPVAGNRNCSLEIHCGHWYAAILLSRRLICLLLFFRIRSLLLRLRGVLSANNWCVISHGP